MGAAVRFWMSFAFAISLVACAGAAPSALTPTTNATSATLATATTASSAALTAATARPPDPTRIGPAPTPGASTTQVASATVTPQRLSVPLYLGIEQGTTSDGFPTLGRPDAPIVLSDYSDFL